MAKAHVMTPKRRAALKKAQTASARKRRGHGKGKLAKANRTISRQRKVAVVAATGGLALAAAGVAGHYYIRKTAGGGPKAKKLNHSSASARALDHSVARAQATLMRTGGMPNPPRSRAGSAVIQRGTRRTRLRNTRRDLTSGFGSNHVWNL